MGNRRTWFRPDKQINKGETKGVFRDYDNTYDKRQWNKRQRKYNLKIIKEQLGDCIYIDAIEDKEN